MAAAVEIVSMQDSLIQAIQKRIFSGELQPGQRVLEEDLAATFGVSRATLRESLRRLEQLGLVEIKPRKGTFIRTLTIQEVERTCRLRALLESLAARYASEAVTESDLAELRRRIDAMGSAAEANDLDEFLAADREFHGRIWKLAGDPQLEHILRYLSSPYFAFVARLSTFVYSDVQSIFQAHQRYLAVLTCGDPDLVQRTVQQIHEDLARDMLVAVRQREIESPQLICKSVAST